MPFVQAKCPECGGMLAVDNSKKAAMCQFCGEAFIVQEAVNNYITNNITEIHEDNRVSHNYGDGAVVNVYENTSKDFVIEGGVLKKYQGASTDVVIPEGVIELGEDCFEGLSVESVAVPVSVKSIDKFAFNRCNSLISINVNENNPSYSSVMGVLFNKDKTELVLYPSGKTDTDYVVLDSVTHIGESSFCCHKSLTSITIPDSVTNIGISAFLGCERLASIVIPNSVTSIDEWAFSNCESLVSVEIPDGVTSVGDYAFRNCTNLTSVTIPDSVTSIGRNAFENCSSLKIVTISDCFFVECKNAFDETLYNKIMKEKQEAKFAKTEAERQAKIQAEKAEKQRIIAERKSKGLCQHCGGTFKGLFSSKCSSCGKPKDY